MRVPKDTRCISPSLFLAYFTNPCVSLTFLKACSGPCTHAPASVTFTCYAFERFFSIHLLALLLYPLVGLYGLCLLVLLSLTILTSNNQSSSPFFAIRQVEQRLYYKGGTDMSGKKEKRKRIEEKKNETNTFDLTPHQMKGMLLNTAGIWVGRCKDEHKRLGWAVHIKGTARECGLLCLSHETEEETTAIIKEALEAEGISLPTEKSSTLKLWRGRVKDESELRPTKAEIDLMGDVCRGNLEALHTLKSARAGIVTVAGLAVKSMLQLVEDLKESGIEIDRKLPQA